MRAARLLPVLPLLLTGAAALGHLPTLTADPVWSAEEGEVVLTHGYGHPAMAQWFDCARPDQVTIYAPDGAEFDATPSLAASGEPGAVRWRTRFRPIQTGDHIALLRCRSRVGDLQFDDFVKVVVHAGGAPQGWDREVGAPLELIPLTRPYALPKGSSFRVRLLAGGQPVANATVGLEHLLPAPPLTPPPSELHTIRQERTNALGEVCVTLPEEGWWVLFATRAGGTVEEDGRALERRHRAGFWIPVGW